MQRSSLVSAAAVLAAQLSLPAQAGEGHAHGEGAADGMPRLSLVLDAQYARDNQGGEAHEIIEESAGILHGVHFHEDDHGQENGFGLGASELAVEADLPSQLKARVSLALNVDEIELEEAWVQTQGLPSGLSVKAGRFLSGIGYLNGQHPHEQDFVNGNLVYTPDLDFVGTDTFTYTITDGDGDKAAGALVISVDDDTPTGGAGTTAWLDDDSLAGSPAVARVAPQRLVR